MLELQAFTALSMKCRTTHHKESPAEESPFFILGLTYREKKMKKQTLLLLRGAILLLLCCASGYALYQHIAGGRNEQAGITF